MTVRSKALRMRLLATVPLVALAIGSAQGEESVRSWIGTESVCVWTQVAYWQDGLVAGDGDTVDFSLAAGAAGNDLGRGTQLISWTLGGAVTLPRVYGGLSRRLELTVASGKTLTLDDPNAFFGTWAFLAPYAVTLNSTAQHTVSLDRLDPLGGARLTVPTAATEAVVSNVVGTGTLAKEGAGTLRLVRTSGQANVILENEGSVVVEGKELLAESELAAVLAKAAFHVDADKADSFEYTEGDDPRVSKWCDVRGAATMYASQLKQNNQTFHLPRRVTNFAGAHAVVDFGNYQPTGITATNDPNCCALNWSAVLERVADAFIVVCNSENSHVCAPVFSHTVSKVFYRGGQGSFVPTLGYNVESAATGGADMRPVRDGFFSVDGLPIFGETPVDLSGALKVVTFSTREEGAWAPLGSFAAQYGQRTGGIRIGEAVYFTTKLTDAERQLVSRYLRKKWTSAAAAQDWDVGAWIKSAGADSSIPVAAGKTLRVRQLKADAETLTKTGAGTLELGAIEGSATKQVVVAGGTVRLAERVALPASLRPAANSYRHFDASDGASLVCDADGVAEWKDQSGVAAKSALRATNGTGNKAQNVLASPQIVEKGCNGRNTLSFGTYDALVKDSTVTLKGAAMMFCPRTETQSENVREGFLVVRKNGANTDYAFLFGPNSSNMFLDFYSGGSCLFRREYASPYIHGAQLTCDGVAIHSLDTGFNWCTDYHVIRFSSSAKVRAHGFCEDRDISNMGVGGWTFGEVLLYDRVLTDAERIETEAYLMEKWLAKPHPLNRASAALPLARVELAVGAKFAAEAPIAVGEFAIADAKLDLAEAKNVTIGTLMAPALQEISVGSGEVAVAMDDGLTQPVYRFDASDTAGMTLEDGTNVVTWLDAGRNGAKAESFKDQSYTTSAPLRIPAKRHPSLTEVEINGQTKTVVDFGVWHGSSDLNSNPDVANEIAIMMLKTPSGATGFANVREVMAFELLKASSVFSFTDKDYYNFHRSSSYLFHSDWAKGDAHCNWMTNALVRVDNVASDVQAKVSNNTWYNFDFAALSPGDKLHVGTFARDRTSNFGGLQLAESIGFDKVLSDAERAYWQSYFEWKWRSVGTEPVWTNAALAKVSIAAGGTFSPSAKVAQRGVTSTYCVGELSGAGTFDANVTGVATVRAEPGFAVADDLTLESGATLNLAVSADGPAPLTVGGTLTAGAVTLDVSPAGELLPPGTYPLVTAGTLAADTATWTLTATEPFTRHQAELVRDAQTLALVIRPRGMIFLVR